MSVTKLTMSGFKPSTFNKYDDFLAGNAAYDPAATWLIQRITATGGETSITFSSIPQTYKHLQIRFNFTTSANGNWILLQSNSDTTTANYPSHALYGTGSSAAAGGWANGGYAGNAIYGWGYGTIANTYPMVGITDILDYTSTSKNKTIKTFTGCNNNSTTLLEVTLSSGLWLSTSSISSLKILFSGAATLNAGSTIALYGFTG